MAASAGMCVEAGDDGTMRGLSSAIHQADAIQHFGERRGWRKVRVET